MNTTKSVSFLNVTIDYFQKLLVCTGIFLGGVTLLSRAESAFMRFKWIAVVVGWLLAGLSLLLVFLIALEIVNSVRADEEASWYHAIVWYSIAVSCWFFVAAGTVAALGVAS